MKGPASGESFSIDETLVLRPLRPPCPSGTGLVLGDGGWVCESGTLGDNPISMSRFYWGDGRPGAVLGGGPQLVHRPCLVGHELEPGEFLLG
jgi:hypothetical protein